MKKEVAQFCELLQELEDEGHEVLCWVCMGLGIGQKGKDVPFSPEAPLSELLHPYSVDQLRERLNYLIDEQGISSEVLIPGSFQSVLDYYDYSSDESKLSNNIDMRLDTMKGLERILSKAFDDRIPQIDDETLRVMIGRIREGLGNTRPHLDRCAQTSEAMKEKWAMKFPGDYWINLQLGIIGVTD